MVKHVDLLQRALDGLLLCAGCVFLHGSQFQAGMFAFVFNMKHGTIASSQK